VPGNDAGSMIDVLFDRLSEEANHRPILLNRSLGYLAAARYGLKHAVSGSFDETLRVWDLEGNQPPCILEGDTELIRAVALSSDGRRAVSGSKEPLRRCVILHRQRERS
jgi:WD40 repeat protein